MTHTQGPWSYTADMYGLDNMRVFGVNDATGNGVANCGYDQRGESMANARLIAAAPDMLAALEAVIDDLEEHIGVAVDHYASERWLEGAKARLGAAQMAIAKAKGEA